MAGHDYDLLVVGTGIASMAPARRCAAAGWRVALVDERPPGGTCALRGCSPKKMMRAGPEVLDGLARMAGRGVDPGTARGDWGALIRHARGFTDPIPGNNKEIYAKQGIDFVPARARFVDEGSMALEDEHGGSRVVSARHIVLATGARPAPMAFDGARHLVDSDAFFEIEDLPERVAFVGGGFISMEFAHMAARHGVRAIVVHSRQRPLKDFDPDLVDQLVAASRGHAGIEFVLGARVDAIEARSDGSFLVRAGDARVECGLAVHGAGRVPNIDALDLAAGGVESTRDGIVVDAFQRSPTNRRVYAGGDCAADGAPQLSLSASAAGRAIARNLLDGADTARADLSGQASVAYTLPAIARAGMLESEARAAGRDIEVRAQDTTRWFTNRRMAEPAGGFKVILDKESDTLLGAHFLGHHCEEFINVFALAIRHGITRAQLKETLWAHPSSGSDLSRILG